MKKNVLIIILLLISSFSLFYAYAKTSEANFARNQANQLQEHVETLRDEAKQMQAMAQEASKEARRQVGLTLEAMDNCQSKKQ
ncbi:hypothetical protein [Ekhidna sp.]|uniref:hypothetical protein n=1 Tax=Ekhidna sp. TaxID=2608089 RepID=UPI003299176F